MHNTPNYPTQHKYPSMLYRLIKILMKQEYYTAELNPVIYIAQENCYKQSTIGKLLNEPKHTKTQNTSQSKQEHRAHTINPVSYTHLDVYKRQDC